jgi:HNH endonuclease
VRDKGCAFPDCGRPQPWCDPHHIVHWTNGGPTALPNLVLLCRRHHRLIHHERFSVEMADGLPRFHRADGSVLEAADRAPP